MTVREDRELCTQDDVGLQQIDKTRRGRLVYKKSGGTQPLTEVPPKDFPPILPGYITLDDGGQGNSQFKYRE